MYKRNKHDVFTIFDCGANKGQYALNVNKIFSLNGNGEKQVRIYSFEPSTKTFRQLKENTEIYQNIHIFNFGLSDEEGDQSLYYEEEGSGLASLYKRQLDYINIDFNKSESVTLKTLDGFYKENQCDCIIDLLKIDVEGNELKVLNGAQQLLSKNKIENIQIEFGGCNIDSRTYFRDFWNLLHDRFKVYRILKDGIFEIKQYDERLEVFSCSNYLFSLM